MVIFMLQAPTTSEMIRISEMLWGHLYALNLRNQFLSHLSLSSDGTKKKPHDMGVLKKLDVMQLRQGAANGTKVLYKYR